MKKILNILSILAIVSLVVLVGCKKKKKDPVPAGKETGEAMAFSAWAPSNVSLDGTPRDEWGSFVLNFTVNTTDYNGGSYSTSGLPSEDADKVTWKDSGTWSFKANSDGTPNLGVVVRDDGIEMNLTVGVTEDGSTGTLNLSFDVVDPSARTEGFYGHWVFAMSF